ncbi:copper methylamine oxidase-like [Olea europaea subsp. europaea]|uniref:Copper methylamine oxidase-like n=1 Tax=Olea europaea subsp. europaea TaxID=158383 RepID=A0A8S0Q4S9_OLEEU|nr:copper methylamine oxidase-like [Olea europaea subsp. europaea]
MRWKLPWCYVSYSIHFLRFADLGVQIAGNFAPVEEQPVMPVECISFMLQPHGFFNRSSAMDLSSNAWETDAKENDVKAKPLSSGVIAKL